MDKVQLDVCDHIRSQCVKNLQQLTLILKVVIMATSVVSKPSTADTVVGVTDNVEKEYEIIKCHPGCYSDRCIKNELATDNISKGMVNEKDPIKVTQDSKSHIATIERTNDNVTRDRVLKGAVYKDEKDGKSVEDITKMRGRTFHRVPYSRNNVYARQIVDVNRKSMPILATGINDPSMSVQRKSTVLETADTRKMEKNDMQNLNSRLATFIEKVRYLEAYNKALITEIEKLRNTKAATGNKLREMYEEELNQSRKALNDAMGQLSSADITILDLMEQVKDANEESEDVKRAVDGLRKKNENLEIEVGDYQGEVTRLSDRCDQLESELEGNRDLTRQLQDSTIASKADLDEETMRHLDAENRAKLSETQLNFVTGIYEQEIAELKDLLNERRADTEVKEYWQGELSRAVGEIQREYDQRLDNITKDMEGKVSLQIQSLRQSAATSDPSVPYVKEELSRQKSKMAMRNSQIMDLQSENARLKSNVDVLTRQVGEVNGEMESDRARMAAEIQKLKNELETVLYELQMLMNAKLSMQMEIATYKKLLEHEETRENIVAKEATPIERVGVSLHPNVPLQPASLQPDVSGQPAPSQPDVSRQPVSLQPDVSEQRRAVGDVVFNEATLDGRYVSIKNRAKDAKAKPVLLKGWSICRVSPEGKKIVYTFGDVKISPFETIKVWGKGNDSKFRTLKDGLVTDFDSWGTGNSNTYLYNSDNQEKASIKLMID